MKFLSIKTNKMNNNLYQIIPLSGSSLLIVAKSWVRPDYYLKFVANEIKTLSVYKEIYFDFLIKNGPKDRFYKAKLTPNNLSFASFESINVDSEIQDKANDFFSQNFELINQSYLTAAQKFSIKKKLTKKPVSL